MEVNDPSDGEGRNFEVGSNLRIRGLIPFAQYGLNTLGFALLIFSKSIRLYGATHALERLVPSS